MKRDDVASPAIAALHHIADYTQTPRSQFFAGYEHLIDERALPSHVDWETAATLFDRLDELCAGKCDIEHVGRLSVQLPAYSGICRVMGFVASPLALYRMIWRWAGPKMFPIMDSTHELLPNGRFRGTITIPEHCRPCVNLFRFNTGGSQAVPRILGLPDSVVECETSARSHTMTITPPQSRTFVSRLGRAWRALRALPHVSAELAHQQDSLTRQYRELVAAHDEAQRLRELAESAQHRAESALLVKSEFISTMSHELRTPLNGILGGLQGAMADDPEKLTEWFDIVERSAEALTRRVDDMLDFSRLERGEIHIEPRSFELRSVLERGLEGFEEQARSQNLTFQLQWHAKLEPRVVSDPLRIVAMLRALVENALKFTSRGGVDVEVRTLEGADRCFVTLEIEVRDTGEGVEESMRESIFRAYTLGDASMTRARGGVGLGLAICRRIASAMQGSLTLRSESGVGSSFVLSLPVGRPPSPAVDSESASHQARAVS